MDVHTHDVILVFSHAAADGIQPTVPPNCTTKMIKISSESGAEYIYRCMAIKGVHIIGTCSLLREAGIIICSGSKKQGNTSGVQVGARAGLVAL